VPKDDLPYLPLRETMKRTLNKRRAQNYPSEPKSLLDAGHIPEQFTTIGENKEGLLLADTIDDDKYPRNSRTVLFGRVEDLKILNKSKILYVDGTLKTAPSIFCQFFTIHAEHIMNHPLPLVYALLPDKRTESYEFVFQSVVDACTRHRLRPPNPEKVLSTLNLPS